MNDLGGSLRVPALQGSSAPFPLEVCSACSQTRCPSARWAVPWASPTGTARRVRVSVGGRRWSWWSWWLERRSWMGRWFGVGEVVELEDDGRVVFLRAKLGSCGQPPRSGRSPVVPADPPGRRSHPPSIGRWQWIHTECLFRMVRPQTRGRDRGALTIMTPFWSGRYWD